MGMCRANLLDSWNIIKGKLQNIQLFAHDTQYRWMERNREVASNKILRLPIMENSSLWNKTSSCRWTIGQWQTLYNDINRFTECEPLVRKLLSELSYYAPVVQLQGKNWPRLQNLLIDAPTGLLFSFLSKKENCSESWAILYNCWGKLLRTKNCFYNTSATNCCYLIQCSPLWVDELEVFAITQYINHRPRSLAKSVTGDKKNHKWLWTPPFRELNNFTAPKKNVIPLLLQPIFHLPEISKTSIEISCTYSSQTT